MEYSYSLYNKLYSTNITELNLSKRNLTYIDSNIKYFVNLQILDLSDNQIKEIPKEIQYLTQLQRVYLSNNQIKEIPKEIQYLTQLEYLNFNRNEIKEIPKEIQHLTQIQELYLSSNQIKEIPKEIQYLTQLQELALYDNQIEEIPKEIQYLTQLQELYLYNNQIKEFPFEITNLRNLTIFHCSNNQIENLLNPIINRFIQRIKNRGGNIHNLYTDTQNVHTSSIQQSIKDSIYNLLKQVKNDIKINYLDDEILTIQTKEALVEYSKDETIHGQLNCTFEEILQAVLLEINKLPIDMQIEVKKRLNEEMDDGICKCFTGRLSRLVNSLSGYSDKVSIKISSAEEIGNIISIMKSKYNDIEEVKHNVEKELLERGYEKEVVDEWLTYID